MRGARPALLAHKGVARQARAPHACGLDHRAVRGALQPGAIAGAVPAGRTGQRAALRCVAVETRGRRSALAHAIGAALTAPAVGVRPLASTALGARGTLVLREAQQLQRIRGVAGQPVTRHVLVSRVAREVRGARLAVPVRRRAHAAALRLQRVEVVRSAQYARGLVGISRVAARRTRCAIRVGGNEIAHSTHCNCCGAFWSSGSSAFWSSSALCGSSSAFWSSSSALCGSSAFWSSSSALCGSSAFWSSSSALCGSSGSSSSSSSSAFWSSSASLASLGASLGAT